MATFLGADYIGYFLPGWVRTNAHAYMRRALNFLCVYSQIIINASVGGVPIKIQAWFYK